MAYKQVVAQNEVIRESRNIHLHQKITPGIRDVLPSRPSCTGHPESTWHVGAKYSPSPRSCFDSIFRDLHVAFTSRTTIQHTSRRTVLGACCPAEIIESDTRQLIFPWIARAISRSLAIATLDLDGVVAILDSETRKCDIRDSGQGMAVAGWVCFDTGSLGGVDHDHISRNNILDCVWVLFA